MFDKHLKKVAWENPSTEGCTKFYLLPRSLPVEVWANPPIRAKPATSLGHVKRSELWTFHQRRLKRVETGISGEVKGRKVKGRKLYLGTLSKRNYGIIWEFFPNGVPYCDGGEPGESWQSGRPKKWFFWGLCPKAGMGGGWVINIWNCPFILIQFSFIKKGNILLPLSQKGKMIILNLIRGGWSASLHCSTHSLLPSQRSMLGRSSTR